MNIFSCVSSYITFLIFFIFLGESIYFFFKIQNDSILLVADSLQVKIELRSPKYLSILHEETFSKLNFTCSIDRTLVHEINDLGM